MTTTTRDLSDQQDRLRLLASVWKGEDDIQWLVAIAKAACRVPKPRETDLMLGDAEWWLPLRAALEAQ